MVQKANARMRLHTENQPYKLPEGEFSDRPWLKPSLGQAKKY